MDVGVLLLALLPGTKVATPQVACQSAEACFATLRTRWELQLVGGDAIVPGTYRRTSGLDGNNLYLFADRTFFSCHWSDNGPAETVEARGRWRVERGVLELTPDWERHPDPWYERRFVPVRGWQAREGLRLAAVDVQYPFLYALEWQGTWAHGQDTAAKSRLMRVLTKQGAASQK